MQSEGSLAFADLCNGCHDNELQPIQQLAEKILREKELFEEGQCDSRPLFSIVKQLVLMEAKDIEFCIDSYQNALIAKSQLSNGMVDLPAEEPMDRPVQEAEATQEQEEHQEGEEHVTGEEHTDWYAQWWQKDENAPSWSESAAERWQGDDWGDSWGDDWEEDSWYYSDTINNKSEGKRKAASKGTGKGETQKGVQKGKTTGSEKAGKGSGKKGGKHGKEPVCKKLYVGNLPADISEKPLKNVFRKYGLIEDIHIMHGRSKKTRQSGAMIVFSTEAESKSCVEAMALGYEFRLGEGDLIVKFADDQAAPGSSGSYTTTWTSQSWDY